MKKFLSIQLTVAMILSLTSYNTLNVYAADVTEPVNVYTKDIELDETVLKKAGYVLRSS